MKFLARLILIAILTLLLSHYTPWWVIMVISFAVSFVIHGSGMNVFISGFLGAGIVWLGYAWYLDFKSESWFSEKMVMLMPVDDPMMLTILAGLVGGVCGGFSALSGNSFKMLFVKKKAKSFYN